jgi:hypothetical protein
MATKDKRGRLIHYGLAKSGRRYFSRVNECGQFFVYRDQQKPTITALALSEEMRSAWKIKIEDNLIPAGKIEDLEYKATVNGQWILMRYDKKNDVLIFDDFKRLPPRPFKLQVQVRDYCGNVAEWEQDFD